jgi:cellulose synthase operon protein C
MPLMQRIAYARLAKEKPQHALCLVELVELAGATAQSPTYNVNIRQGPAKGAQRDSALFVTPTPSREIAEARAMVLLQSKLEQGWQLQQAEGFSALATPAPRETISAATAPHPVALPASLSALLDRLHPDRWRLLAPRRKSRSLWRLAEWCGAGHDAALRPLAPRLVSWLESGNDLLDYCIAYALGRLGDVGAREAMQQLAKRGRSAATRRVAQQAFLALGGIPVEKALTEANIEEAYDLATQSNASLCAAAREKVLQAAHVLDLAHGSFKTFRVLYKNAEFRRDGELLSVLHARLENTHGKGASRDFSGKYQAGRAFSRATRQYLRLRTWRNVRRMALMEHPQSIALATDLLLGIEDAALPPARQATVYEYINKQHVRKVRHFSPYANNLLIRSLLLARHPDVLSHARSRQWWSDTPLDLQTPAPARYEAFPALWDTQPASLLRLLMQSRAAVVHAFATRALADNPAYVAQLDEAALTTLLHSDFAATVRFAATAVCQRIEAGTDRIAQARLLALLVKSGDATAQQFAQLHIASHLADYATQALLVAALITSPDLSLRQLGGSMASLTAADKLSALGVTSRVLDWLEAADSHSPSLQEILTSLTNVFHGQADAPLWPYALQAPLDRLLGLLLHEAVPVARFAQAWLARMPQGLDAVPPHLLATLLRAEEPDRRALGVLLLNSVPDALLREQAALIADFALSEHAAIRQAARAPVGRLCAQDTAFAENLVSRLGNSLFRSESVEGQHEDVLAWLQTDLADYQQQWDAGYCWRATQAQSRGAQRLGVWLHSRFSASTWSVRQLAQWARNAEQSLRRFSFEQLAALPQSRWQEEAGEVLPLFDSHFDDAREFAQVQFTTTLVQVPFSPMFLVALVDHPKPWVQALGRELLGRKLDSDSALDILLKLSQHPSQDVQLFVTQWLTHTSGTTPAETAKHLRQLQPYFVAVLSQVNRARMAKNRVLNFLHAHAAHADTAQVVADIYLRQVMTASLQDKPKIIAGLRDIAARHPQIALPFVHTRPTPVKAQTSTPPRVV